MNILFVTLLAATLNVPAADMTVSTAWLAQNLDNPNIAIVEIGGGDARTLPHIPGARFVSIQQLVKSGWPPDELPAAQKIAQAFGDAGIGDTGRIILYSNEPLLATRAWFTLDSIGLGHRAAILDGGLKKWMAEKRTVTKMVVPVTSMTFTPYPDATRVIRLDQLKQTIDSGAVLIDARSPHEFHGFRRGDQVTRRGHIPGASCLPWQANLTKNDAFRNWDELKQVYANIVVKPDARIIVYCRTGMEASMPYFILRSLGYDVALYDGSYTEYSRDPAMPVAKLWTRP